MTDVQTIGVLVTATSVSIAAIYYAFTLRINLKNQELSLKTQELALKAQQHNLETRQAQLFMQIYDHFLNATFLNNYQLTMQQKWGNYEDYMKKYGPEKNPEEFNRFQTLTTFFQGVGILVDRGLVDLGLIHDFASATTIASWERFKPIVYGLRAEKGDPYILWAMEKLYADVKNYRTLNPKPRNLPAEKQ